MGWLRHTFTEKLAAVKQNIITDFFLLLPQLGTKVDDSPLLNCHFLGYNNNVTIFQSYGFKSYLMLTECWIESETNLHRENDHIILTFLRK